MEQQKLEGRNIIAFLSMKYEGDWRNMYLAIERREYFPPEEITKAIKTLDYKFVTIIDEEYPQSLKNLRQPPFCLFYFGNLELLKDSLSIAYIGSRDASPYGLRMAREIASELADNGVTIISGMARGIDAEASRAALERGGKLISVLGSGIDIPYPASSEDIYRKSQEVGLVISEYPPGVKAKPTNFPNRNRIIAALPKGLIVGESHQKSGTSKTVCEALSLSKDIGAIPFRSGESETNRLIHDGAYLIEKGEDALDMIGFFKG